MQKSIKNPSDGAQDKGSETLYRIAQQLDAEIEACEQTMESLRESLAQLRAARKQIKAPASVPPPRDGRAPARMPPEAPRSGKRGKRESSDANVIRKFALEAIKDAGRPLNRTELRDQLEKAGISLKAKDPLKRIGKVMWQARQQLPNVGDGYWLAGVPLPDEDSAL